MEKDTEASTLNEKPTPGTVDSNSQGAIYPVPQVTEDAHPIAKVVENYLLAIRNIAQTVNIVMPHLAT